MRIHSGAVVLSAGLIACGGGSASVSGTMLGNTLTPADAVSAQSATGVILISDTPGLCRRVTANQIRKGEQRLRIELSGEDLSPGPYAINPSPTCACNRATWRGAVTYLKFDSNCAVAVSESAGFVDAGAAGDVSLKSLDGSGASGTFDTLMGASDHVTGSFSTTDCAAVLEPTATASTCL